MYLCIFACSSISLQCNDAEKKSEPFINDIYHFFIYQTVYVFNRNKVSKNYLMHPTEKKCNL